MCSWFFCWLPPSGVSFFFLFFKKKTALAAASTSRAGKHSRKPRERATSAVVISKYEGRARSARLEIRVRAAARRRQGQPEGKGKRQTSCHKRKNQLGRTCCWYLPVYHGKHLFTKDNTDILAKGALSFFSFLFLKKKRKTALASPLPSASTSSPGKSSRNPRERAASTAIVSK